MKNKGFTLIEVLIAASIFAMVSMIGATIFMNISQTERKTSLTNAIYEDARVIMEMLAREIRAGTIDYEEYYNVNVLEAAYYGINRGVYGSRFYDPGYYYDPVAPKQGANPKDLGTTCFDGDGNSGACDDAHTILFPLSVDKNTGKNFWNKNDPSENAFCDNGKGICDDSSPPELYLISADGREKTILVKQKFGTNDFALSMIKLEGIDKDTNGVIDTFICQNDYKNNCEKASIVNPEHPNSITYTDDDTLPKKIKTETSFDKSSQFIPISPLRSSIKGLQFHIFPKEDPYKAFAEEKMQYQPYVTIILTLEPSEKERENYPGDPPEITIQTTVSTGVKQKITTYPPTKNLNWIQNVAP